MYIGGVLAPLQSQVVVGTGNWYEIYTGKNGNAGCAFYTGAPYLLPGATDPQISPVYTPDRGGTLCAGTTSGTIRYNGVAVDYPNDVVSVEFEFRYA